MNIMRPADAGLFEDVHTNWQTVTVSSGFTFVNSSSAPLDKVELEPNAARSVTQRTFDRYVHGAMKLAAFLPKAEDGSYVSEIPGFAGVWGSGETMKDCLDNLDEVLREWLLLKIKDFDQDIPVVEDINLNNL